MQALWRAITPRIAIAALALAAGAVVALVLILAFQGLEAARAEREADAAYETARKIQIDSERLLQLTTDAETSQRGFLLLRDPTFLNRFENARRRVPAALDQLRADVAADAEYAALVQEVVRLTDLKFEELARTVDLARTGRMSEALRVVRGGEGRRAMLALRAEVSALSAAAESQADLAEAHGDAIDARGDAIVVPLSLLAFAAALIAAVGLLLERRSAARALVAQRQTNLALAELRERAEGADAAKSALLATVSHDIRQPLNSLSLYLSALGRRVEGEEAQQIITSMQIAAQAMTRMLSSVLDLARIESGVLKPLPANFALQDLLQDVADSQSLAASKMNVRLTLVPTSLAVHTDPDLLETILQNLVGNAVKFARGRRILIGVRRVGGDARIEVHDTGPGIPPDQLERVFGEFVRFERPSVSKGEGLGLGLSIVKRMSDLLDLPILARSSVGKGSVFGVTVPRAAAAVRAPLHASSASLQGLRALVVDDAPVTIDAMRRTLSDVGAIVAIGHSSAEALAAADAARAEGGLDLLVVDLELGLENGLDVAKAVEARNGAKPLAVLVVTGATSSETVSALKQSGRRYLFKPLRSESLIAEAAGVVAEARAAARRSA
ncbi:MAG: ATP-binding protein [Hyphomonadaceae bacterium]